MSAMESNFHKERVLTIDFPDETFSEAQQFVYTMMGAKPIGVDNLDAFNALKNNYSDKLISDAISASFFIDASPWLALNHFITLQGKHRPPLLRNNVLILMAPIQSNSNTPTEQLYAEVEQAVDQLTEQAMNLILDAYKESGTPVTIIESDTNRRTGHPYWFSPMIYVPKDVEYCPKNVTSVSELTNQQFKYCATVVTNRGFVNFYNPQNNTPVPFTISENYAYKLMYLPDGFPIEKLNSDVDNAYVFMPSIIYRTSNILDNITPETLLKLVKEGSITLNPLLKNIHSNQYHYFNPDISRFQTSNFERIDEELLFRKLHDQ